QWPVSPGALLVQDSHQETLADSGLAEDEQCGQPAGRRGHARGKTRNLRPKGGRRGARPDEGVQAAHSDGDISQAIEARQSAKRVRQCRTPWRTGFDRSAAWEVGANLREGPGALLANGWSHAISSTRRTRLMAIPYDPTREALLHPGNATDFFALG